MPSARQGLRCRALPRWEPGKNPPLPPSRSPYTSSERRGDNFNGFEELCLKVKARIWPLLFHSTLEVTQGQIFSPSPTDATRFCWHLYGSRLKRASICPWVASRVVCHIRSTAGGGPRRAQPSSPETIVQLQTRHKSIANAASWYTFTTLGFQSVSFENALVGKIAKKAVTLDSG